MNSTNVQSRAGFGVTHEMVTTAFTLDGYKIVTNLGVVRGITVRSRSVIGNVGAAFQMFFGGNITLFSSLCEQARNEAFEMMLRHATERGANAVIGMRYDATEIMNGVSEVLAYGTAVVVSRG
ncbi:MAG: YbjQ family protein [Deltaproteobacteria bacterium]|nr:YbjQ family protein [Deltaproteobacteria bacterium]